MLARIIIKYLNLKLLSSIRAVKDEKIGPPIAPIKKVPSIFP